MTKIRKTSVILSIWLFTVWATLMGLGLFLFGPTVVLFCWSGVLFLANVVLLQAILNDPTAHLTKTPPEFWWTVTVCVAILATITYVRYA